MATLIYGEPRVVQNCSQHAKFILMPDEQDILALEAIEAVAHQGLKRYRLLLGGILAVIVVGLATYFYLPDRQAKWPVAVLLPNMDEGPVKDNAARQWEGFKLAFDDNDIAESKHRHVYHFSYPLKTDDSEEIDDSKAKGYCEAKNDSKAKDSRKAINDKIKCWYDGGIRTFIITMSGAALKINKDFSEWADTLPSNDRPVLVATVASAPDIVDRENGIFRHYIRSKDESAMIATYIESINPSPSSVGIFHVLDDYGNDAKNLLKKRLNLKKELGVDVYKVLLQKDEQKKNQIEGLVNDFINAKNNVAVIIGYGPMIKYTLDGLKASNSFKGPILVVSTFTEEDWRPEQVEGDECFRDQIRFVGPTIDTDEDNDDWRGVVFQFSYLTLDRALKCKGERGVEKFWNCFTSAELSSKGKNWTPHIEFTGLGDSHISLRLLEMIDDKEVSRRCSIPPETSSG